MRRAGVVVAVALVVGSVGGMGRAHAAPERETKPAPSRGETRDEKAALKRAALHGLALSATPEARAALARIAKGTGQPELRADARHALGFAGGEESRALIAEVYAAAAEAEVKAAALHALMIAHDTARLECRLNPWSA